MGLNLGDVAGIVVGLAAAEAQLQGVAAGETVEVSVANPMTGKGIAIHAFGHRYDILGLSIKRAEESGQPASAPAAPVVQTRAQQVVTAVPTAASPTIPTGVDAAPAPDASADGSESALPDRNF